MKEEKRDKTTKKSKGAWTIGWGWMITVPALAFLSWATKKGIKDALEEEHPSPLTILKERYVKGEIDRNEYEEKLKDLLAS
ncbi:SHOCT domain-containing protein [Marinilabilia rubra]|uniref:SHOCT domain-containing protein n=1 Tax=Marinilabilia rubra TaxID=2162893 RepID=A0A2U2B8S1_9BACT|nr:SHOCT domain-containing protein [Marinilabilia rubra]PWD99457.1 SHOCT domain-containing protein [Marinilabilia rubra]